MQEKQKIAFVFPGQGSQYMGMGKEIYEKNVLAKEVFDRAEEISKIPLKKLCFEGPEKELTLTQNAQLAILTMSIACLRVLNSRRKIVPSCVFGHSLGEFTALYAAGVFEFEEVIRLVKIRGELMGRAGEKKPGTMAAVIGMGKKAVEENLKKFNNRVVLANINCPGQLVISGEKKTILEVKNLLENLGAKRVILLNVSAAFHSPLMEEPYREFKKILSGAKFNYPRFPLIMNATGKLTLDLQEIKNALFLQLRSPVLFWDSVITAREKHINNFIEIGSGRVLTGIIRRIDAKLKTYSFDGTEFPL